MAVAHVTSSQSHASAAFSVSQASFSWTHTTSTDPQGVLVLVYQGVANAEAVTSVTYDGVTIPAVTGGRAQDTATEPGSVKAFFLGASVPTTDNPTVLVTRTNNTTSMWAVCATVTAATDTEAVGVVLTQENAAAAEQSVDDGTTGVNSLRYAGVYSGGATPAPAGTNSTLLGTTNDAGAYGWTAVRETTAGQGARLVGCTVATDDLAGVHLAVRELYTPPGPTVADVQETVWNTTTTPKTVTFAGAQSGDRILVMATGDASASFGNNFVTACDTSTTAGSTGSWTEPAEGLSSADADWISSATTTVSSTGSVTVSVDRTKAGATGGTWGLYALLLRGDGGIGNIAGVTTIGTAQVVSLTVSADSVVAFISGDWDSTTAATALTPAGGVTVERAVIADYMVCAGYWTSQAAGTRNYGGTGGASNALYRCLAVEVLNSTGSNFTQSPSDALGLTDVAALTQNASAADPLGLTDTATPTLTGPGSISQTDVLGLTDSATVVILSTTATDSLGLTDAVAVAQGKSATDALGLTDTATPSLSGAGTISQTDVLGLTDTGVIVDTVQTGSEPLGLTDTAVPEIPRADALGLTDAAAIAHTANQADALGLTDAAAFAHTANQADAFGLTDAVAIAQGKSATDALGLTDTATPSLSGAGSISQTDPAGLTDAIALDLTATAADTLGLTDAAALAQTEGITDQLGLTDTATPTLTAAGAVSQTDPLGLTDAAQFTLTTTVTDQLGLTDTATPTLAAAGTISQTDPVALTDTAALDTTRSAADPLGLTDATAVEPQRLRSATEILGLTDSIVISLAAAVVDPAGLTDLVALEQTSTVADLLAMTDAVTVLVLAPYTPAATPAGAVRGTSGGGTVRAVQSTGTPGGSP